MGNSRQILRFSGICIVDTNLINLQNWSGRRQGKDLRGLPNARNCRNRAGFALIISVTLLVLLALVAVGLLSLSSIAIRTSKRGDSEAVARANAKLALILALGELQKTMGPDRRISASASILEDPASGDSSLSGSGQRHLMGGWRSWEGHDFELNGPISNDTKRQASKDPDGINGGRFLGWMVSEPDPRKVAEIDFVKEPPQSEAAVLVGSGSVEQPSDWIRANKVSVGQGNPRNLGAYAWCVTGENAKGRINLSKRQFTPGADNSLPEIQAEIAAGATSDPRALGGPLANFPTGTPAASKIISMPTTSLAFKPMTPGVLNRYYHDFSSSSMGLLTDANHGGLKQDLSLMFEATKLPAHLNDAWVTPSGVKWKYMQDFYRLYKKHSYPGGDSFTTQNAALDRYGSEGNLHEVVRRSPVVARIQWLFAKSAQPDPAKPSKYVPAIILCPVITLWNPYNTTIRSIPEWVINPTVALPFELKLITPGRRNSWVALGSATKVDYSRMRIILRPDGNSPRGFSLKPGQTRVFSPRKITDSGTLTLYPGYRSRTGFRSPLRGAKPTSGNSTFAAGLKASNGTFNVNFEVDGKWAWAMRFALAPLSAYNYMETVEPGRSHSLSSLAGKPEIFASANFQIKTVQDNTFPSLGLAQSNPLQAHTEIGKSGPTETWLEHSQHPVHSPHDLIIYEHSSWTDTLLPNVDADDLGFVASGAYTDNGVSYCVISELPVRPMQSIIEFQHADLHGNKPTPPYIFNALGNSIAPPLMPGNVLSSSVRINAQWGDFDQTDNSYLLNEKFFDRYFFSSIAPRDSKWSRRPSESAKSVYNAHRNHERKLPNSRYIPYGETGEEDISGRVAYGRIASKLMVEGMFNVNSTSVDAWLMVLSSLHKAKMLYFDVYSDSMVVKTKPDQEFVVSRFTIPAGGSADSDSPAPGQIPEELFWRGYRTLSQDQMEALASEIVKQVKLRGPFLSLAEFVNRRFHNYSSGDELSNRGAIAAALDQPTVTINELLKEFSVPITAVMAEEFEYAMADSAVGYSAYGAPGWVTQADILRPLTPYLSVRDDTFKIRAYGEATDAEGKILARSWCEATIQRIPDYINPSDHESYEGFLNVDGTQNKDFDSKSVNGRFGRRMKITSFRWLSAKEV